MHDQHFINIRQRSSVVAMALIDSTASFEKRCSDIDNTGVLLDGLKAQGVKSFSSLAFTIGTPQTAPSDRQYDDLAVKVFGTSPTLGQVASLRRLHFESTTLIVATLNEQVKSDSAEPGSIVKKLPAAEKQARLEKQQERLAGIKMVGEMSPSHQLLDLVNSILETGAIIWVAPSRCTKRDDEVHANIKPSTATVQVENSTLKLPRFQSAQQQILALNSSSCGPSNEGDWPWTIAGCLTGKFTRLGCSSC